MFPEGTYSNNYCGTCTPASFNANFSLRMGSCDGSTSANRQSSIENTYPPETLRSPLPSGRDVGMHENNSYGNNQNGRGDT